MPRAKPWSRGWFWALVGLAAFVGINVMAANAQSDNASPPSSPTPSIRQTDPAPAAPSADDVKTAMTAYIEAWTAADYDAVLAHTSARCRIVEQEQGMDAELQEMIAGTYDGAVATEATITGPTTAAATVEGFMGAALDAEAAQYVAPLSIPMVLEDGAWLVDDCDSAPPGTEEPDTGATQDEPAPEPEPTLAAYNSCPEANADGVWDMTPDHPRWNPRLDGDGDNVACDRDEGTKEN
jgi:hypothetical protein